MGLFSWQLFASSQSIPLSFLCLEIFTEIFEEVNELNYFLIMVFFLVKIWRHDWYEGEKCVDLTVRGHWPFHMLHNVLDLKTNHKEKTTRLRILITHFRIFTSGSNKNNKYSIADENTCTCGWHGCKLVLQVYQYYLPFLLFGWWFRRQVSKYPGWLAHRQGEGITCEGRKVT